MSVPARYPAPDVITILYVDDEEMALKYFGRSVGNTYQVLTASTADAAIEMLQDEDRQIDIVVTDYRMPGRNGGDLLRQIEREFPYVVRILVTAYAERQVLLDTINSGEIFRILEKPLDSTEVREALRLATELSRKRKIKQQRLLAINETLAFLSHELNTPLAAINNFAKGIQRLIADESVSPRQQTGIARAAQAVDDNSRYCITLLSAFIESVKNEDALITHHNVNTAQQMIASLLDTYPLSPEQRDAIRVDIQQDFPIHTLPNCIALVLSSILSNALHAVQNQASARVSFTALIEDNPQIRISNNGPGIPPKILQRLMNDPVTTHAESGGNGWGLIFCKRIMQAINGSIDVHSSPDCETTFSLHFPAIKRNTK